MWVSVRVHVRVRVHMRVRVHVCGFGYGVSLGVPIPPGTVSSLNECSCYEHRPGRVVSLGGCPEP